MQSLNLILPREELREQHALGEEIANAITAAPVGEPIDESELDDELAELEQEALDNKMLKTGTVPVSDKISTLPAAANGERMSTSSLFYRYLSFLTFYSQITSSPGGGRRRRGASKTPSRDGHVRDCLMQLANHGVF
jgi:hypothetical protein